MDIHATKIQLFFRESKKILGFFIKMFLFTEKIKRFSCILYAISLTFSTLIPLHVVGIT